MSVAPSPSLPCVTTLVVFGACHADQRGVGKLNGRAGKNAPAVLCMAVACTLGLVVAASLFALRLSGYVRASRSYSSTVNLQPLNAIFSPAH